MGRRSGSLHPADDAFPLLSEVADLDPGGGSPGQGRFNVMGLEDGALWEQQPPPARHSPWRSRGARIAALALAMLLALWLLVVRAQPSFRAVA